MVTGERILTTEGKIGENLSILVTSMKMIGDNLITKGRPNIIRDHRNEISGEQIKVVTTGKNNRTRISGVQISNSNRLMVALPVATILVISKATKAILEVTHEETQEETHEAIH